MTCVHGVSSGSLCAACPIACFDCSRLTGGRCWRHTTTTVVLPAYTFRPFEPIDSTVHPFVVASPVVSMRVEAARGSTLGLPPAWLLQ